MGARSGFSVLLQSKAGLQLLRLARRRQARLPVVGGLAALLVLLCVGWQHTRSSRLPAVDTVAANAELLAALEQLASPGPSGLDAALLGHSAALHGPVVKAGPLDESHWHPRAIPAMNANFSTWVKRQEAEGVGELSPFTYPQCAVWGNHEYKFIFVRHPKCGTTSVLHELTLCTEQNAKRSCLKPWSGVHGITANLSSAEVQQLWKDYFVFTVVRNPLTRAVSSYKFVLSATTAAPKCMDLLDWDGFCSDPVAAGQMCRRRPRCCPFGTIFAFAHIPDQARCMVTEQGGLAVDYVARMEHLYEDMAGVYAEINRRRDPSLPPLRYPARFARTDPSNTVKACEGAEPSDRHRAADHPASFFGVQHNFTSLVAKESSYCSLQQWYQGPHEHCLEGISRAYARDIALLYPAAQRHAQQQEQEQQRRQQPQLSAGAATEAGTAAAR